MLEYPPLPHQPVALLILLSSLLIEVPASIPASSTAITTLTSLVLEPSWLIQVYKGWSDCCDRGVAKLVTLA